MVRIHSPPATSQRRTPFGIVNIHGSDDRVRTCRRALNWRSGKRTSCAIGPRSNACPRIAPQLPSWSLLALRPKNRSALARDVHREPDPLRMLTALWLGGSGRDLCDGLPSATAASDQSALTAIGSPASASLPLVAWPFSSSGTAATLANKWRRSWSLTSPIPPPPPYEPSQRGSSATTTAVR